ncbi:MAG: tRNA (adenosine(37)-N6)-threonylcarbamoyltransferase complex ATPase subunit type 1 TsaE [Bacteroidales bacterium]|nr:tRNA (adenosine(37)-N6)-threonylcarbamoyltransferase complex ATPase subunit type 1 TsaE [Bacteroidales bacterium]
MKSDENFPAQVLIQDISSLENVAKSLLTAYPDHRIFAFYGKMGAGKTTFIKKLCEYLQVTDEVTSPTFAIVNVYATTPGDEIFHFDFYRINHLKEIYDIGYEDYFYSGSYCFIEWPELAEEILPEATLKISLEVSEDEITRVLRILPVNNKV